MKGAALWAVVVATTLGLTPVDPVRPELQGLYGARGIDGDDSEYTALVQIIKFRDSYLLSWSFSETAEALALDPDAIGVGITRGSLLSVSYFTESFAGVIVYDIDADGRRLVGHWTGAGGDGLLRTEVLTRLDSGQRLAAADRGQTRR
jgi:hypothetical protein